MRADGRKVREGLSAIERAIPYIMPKRVDAQNYVTEYVDEEVIRGYIREVRRVKGVRLSRMAVLIAAYYLSARRHPYINRFVVNSRIYQRNHFCVSFVMLKSDTNGKGVQTTVKVFLEPGDNVFTINEKISALIEENSRPVNQNNTDKFAAFMFSIPLLPKLVLGLARLLDHFGLLPRFVIDLSPFHTSMFITNLASIQTSSIYHHIYEFGTTSVFVSMGKSVPNFLTGELKSKLIPIKVVMDERICTGHDYAMFYKTMRRFLKNPALLEEDPLLVSVK
jgi:pyruvate/2-oxoglutarate dehydrogenase complex dihydrolipoamide acyltransferase (E2) component